GGVFGARAWLCHDVLGAVGDRMGTGRALGVGQQGVAFDPQVRQVQAVDVPVAVVVGPGQQGFGRQRPGQGAHRVEREPGQVGKGPVRPHPGPLLQRVPVFVRAQLLPPTCQAHQAPGGQDRFVSDRSEDHVPVVQQDGQQGGFRVDPCPPTLVRVPQQVLFAQGAYHHTRLPGKRCRCGQGLLQPGPRVFQGFEVGRFFVGVVRHRRGPHAFPSAGVVLDGTVNSTLAVWTPQRSRAGVPVRTATAFRLSSARAAHTCSAVVRAWSGVCAGASVSRTRQLGSKASSHVSVTSWAAAPPFTSCSRASRSRSAAVTASAVEAPKPRVQSVPCPWRAMTVGTGPASRNSSTGVPDVAATPVRNSTSLPTGGRDGSIRVTGRPEAAFCRASKAPALNRAVLSACSIVDPAPSPPTVRSKVPSELNTEKGWTAATGTARASWATRQRPCVNGVSVGASVTPTAVLMRSAPSRTGTPVSTSGPVRTAALALTCSRAAARIVRSRARSVV